MMNLELNGLTFIDAEVALDGKAVLDMGAITADGNEFHSASMSDMLEFLRGSKYICGHNILNHDLKYIGNIVSECGAESFIDTLYLSPLLFPKKPYHRLVKDDKLTVDELNNPLNDAKKARDLFFDEVTAFKRLDRRLQDIYVGLLADKEEFIGFFKYVGYVKTVRDIRGCIHETFAGRICENASIKKLVKQYPVELAYALAIINVRECDSITPSWVSINYPNVRNVVHVLRGIRCRSCSYCDKELDEKTALKRFFGYDDFRSYDGVPLQRSAVKAAVDGKSLLAVFPTGGGKSITFQLPALMAGLNERGLTVVISPLQSLMKDQTDNLERQHAITDAVTINGSLNPLERAKSFERVADGSASILYISPESLRSRSIELLLLNRNIVRFVIDEAHCFSSWGQDFRVDYLYIGDFIRGLQEQKGMLRIPISCFTATAKQKVIDDIRDYFKTKLSLDLEVFRASAMRKNLNHYTYSEGGDKEKYSMLRQLIMGKDCPTIVYVSRTRQTVQIAARLTEDGCPARPYHGQMDKKDRVVNQDAFMSGEVKIIVATTAFGMGVDKKDVGMVIHYDISDSLENYVQEAGRAGRDESINADCYVLFNDDDLNKHFYMLNQSKLSIKEIQQVWKALKELTKDRYEISQSALEIARKSGWDDSVSDIETRIKTSVNALEQSGFVRRGQNMPRVFANSILVKNMEEARIKIDASKRFDDTSREQAIRIIVSLISAKSRARTTDKIGETRIDYIADRLGIDKNDVIKVIGLLREEKILADDEDLVAYIKEGKKTSPAKHILSTHKNIENFLFEYLDDEAKTYNIKEMNETLQNKFPKASIRQLSTILNYFSIKKFVKRTLTENKNHVTLEPYFPIAEIRSKSDKRYRIADMITDYFLKVTEMIGGQSGSYVKVDFSVLELRDEFNHNLLGEKIETEEVEDALYYLQKIDAMDIEGGFLVIYNTMRIKRLEKDNRVYYRKEHYKKLDEYYQNKRQQIHIVGEYIRRMINDIKEAETFEVDYFTMNNDMFLRKYFKNREVEINTNITPKKYKQLFGELSPLQRKIIDDHESKCIVVGAGPGSGKTKLLTHKLASLYIMEDVKHEQMLMLTFSRAAATEFKQRLMTLIGNAANFIQITTFHSYCFDLLGKVGDIEKSDTIIGQAVEKINAEEVDVSRFTKTVLVIDEAQDMSAMEYALVKILMEKNEGLRVIAVGDDDQNIYEFRGSSSAHFESLLNESGAKKYELVDNFRSKANIVNFANQFVKTISHRFKKTSITPRTTENGVITVCKIIGNNIVTPVVNAVLDIKPLGSTCIISKTNEETLNIIALLRQNGITAQQIQSNNDFNLYDLVELRDFADGVGVDSYDDGYTIDDELWQNEKSRLIRKYEGSSNLQGALKLLGDFEQTHNKTKYKSELKQFIRESKLEDLISTFDGTIFASTIHQTKGREFDNVFLAMSLFPKMDDEAKRKIYVAITRAKQSLHIFSNGDCFDSINVENMKRMSLNVNNMDQSLICFQLSHKDVFLDYFASRRREIDSLMSGQDLLIKDTGCFWKDREVVRFSKMFCEKINMWKDKGYVLSRAYIRHIVFWKGRDQDKEIKIILPNVELSRSSKVSVTV